MMDFGISPQIAGAAVAATVLFSLYYIYQALALRRRRNAFKRARGCLPAPWYPLRDPILGLDSFKEQLVALKQKRLLEMLSGRFARSGNTMQNNALGLHVHFTMEPENLKTMQAVDFKKWGLPGRRKFAFRPLLGLGIFTTDGDDWHRSREMLRPQFARSQIADLPTFEKHVTHVISAIPKDGSTVNLSDLFFRLTMDSATEFLFGESTESLTSSSEGGFAQAFTRSQFEVAGRSRWGGFARLLPYGAHWAADLAFVNQFVDHYVEIGVAKRQQSRGERAPEHKGRYIFLDEICQQTQDPIRIRSESLNILLAGRDTTASLLTNVWFTLSSRPDIWAKLQKEIATLNGAIPTYAELKELKYVRSLMDESLRLYPVVPLNTREALEDTTLPLGGGPDGTASIFIKKGESVSWSVYAMHRRKDYYGEDAEIFRPERWLDDPVSGRKGMRAGWHYLPFNGGNRICLGQREHFRESCEEGCNADV